MIRFKSTKVNFLLISLLEPMSLRKGFVYATHERLKMEIILFTQSMAKINTADTKYREDTTSSFC